jgi:predicted nucleotidyltransferase
MNWAYLLLGVFACNEWVFVITFYMFKKEKEILLEISEKLSADRRVLKIIAYGSRVRGDYRGESDLDLLVVVNKKDKELKDKILSTFYSYELETDISFSAIILSIEEFEFNERLGSPFIESIKEEGITIYDSEYRRKEGTLKISS